jgi:hypothetical protein
MHDFAVSRDRVRGPSGPEGPPSGISEKDHGRALDHPLVPGHFSPNSRHPDIYRTPYRPFARFSCRSFTVAFTVFFDRICFFFSRLIVMLQELCFGFFFPSVPRALAFFVAYFFMPGLGFAFAF